MENQISFSCLSEMKTWTHSGFLCTKTAFVHLPPESSTKYNLQILLTIMEGYVWEFTIWNIWLVFFLHVI